MMNKFKAYRGSIFHFLREPMGHDDSDSYRYFDDGLLLLDEQGKILRLGSYNGLLQELPEHTEIIDYSGNWIIPGFIDTHIHYAQMEIIASFGQQLLEWLNTYVFPAERKHENPEYADQIAKLFIEELLHNGTTTAMTYSTVHKVSAEALFKRASDVNMRIFTGKTLMDRHAPDYLLDTPQLAYDESKELLNKWHNKGRLSYVITPRFAPTSTEAQLEMAQALVSEFPDAYVQTHLSENKDEVEWVKNLYPWAKDYTDVYDNYSLLGSRSVFGHAIHLSDREFKRLVESQSIISWCPTSNFFLGSGIFDINKAKLEGNRIGIGTDVGAGSSFSILRTLNVAYKAAAMQGVAFSPLDGFYSVTLGGAKALSVADKIGNFETGKEADFLVLDMNSTPLLCNKMSRANTIEEKIFNLMVLGDDRAIAKTYICGRLAYEK